MIEVWIIIFFFFLNNFLLLQSHCLNLLQRTEKKTSLCRSEAGRPVWHCLNRAWEGVVTLMSNSAAPPRHTVRAAAATVKKKKCCDASSDLSVLYWWCFIEAQLLCSSQTAVSSPQKSHQVPCVQKKKKVTNGRWWRKWGSKEGKKKHLVILLHYDLPVKHLSPLPQHVEVELRKHWREEDKLSEAIKNHLLFTVRSHLQKCIQRTSATSSGQMTKKKTL